MRITRSTPTDPWADWLLSSRHARDERLRADIVHEVQPIWERLISAARLRPGEHILDLGSGAGNLGLTALAAVRDLRVTFADVSETLLSHCRSRTEELGYFGQSAFARISADSLDPLPDGEFSAVLCRSVIIYHQDPRAAVSEIRRVLEPGGRLSLFEPIGTFSREPSSESFFGLELRGAGSLGLRVRDAYWNIIRERAPYICDLDERQLVEWLEDAGFTEIRLQLELLVSQMPPSQQLPLFLDAPRNPLVPSLRSLIRQVLGTDDAMRLEDEIAEAVLRRQGQKRTAVCYVAATN